jgi:hypothetical protein
MKFRPRKPKKTTETLRWVAIAALAIIALDSFFRLGFIFGPTFSRSNDVPTRKGASARSRVSFTDQTILPEKRQKGEVKGKDIVLVVGSDGHHPLDVHIREIKANREDYAAFHGTNFQTLC